MKTKIKLLLVVMLIVPCIALAVIFAGGANTMPTVLAASGETGIPDTNWYNTTDTEFEIGTADELAGLAVLVNGGETFSSKTIKLTGNIDLSAYGKNAVFNSGKGWTPIGYGRQEIPGEIETPEYKEFYGTFDGNGKIITGLYINDAELHFAGLFGFINGDIKNLGLENVDITNRFYAGGLVGRNTYGTIENCYVTGSVSSNFSAGGIAGGGDTFINCYADCIVTAFVTQGLVNYNGYRAGGIAGTVGSGSFNYCYALGTAEAISSVGGIVGLHAQSTEISNCVALNEQLSGDSETGCIIGSMYNDEIVTCTLIANYASADILDKDGNTNWAYGANSKDGFIIIEDVLTVDFWTVMSTPWHNWLGAVWDTDIWLIENSSLPQLLAFITMDAETPEITEQPNGGNVLINQPFTLTVTASVSDGGTLSYQWYRNFSGSTTGGAAIEGATNSTYAVNTSADVRWYYYVIVTNTNNNAIVNKTAFITSDVCMLSVFKYDGAAVYEPGGGVPGYEYVSGTKITLTPATIDPNSTQEIEYAVTQSDSPNSYQWKSDRAFTHNTPSISIQPNTLYNCFARAKENATHYAGTPVMWQVQTTELVPVAFTVPVDESTPYNLPNGTLRSLYKFLIVDGDGDFHGEIAEGDTLTNFQFTDTITMFGDELIAMGALLGMPIAVTTYTLTLTVTNTYGDQTIGTVTGTFTITIDKIPGADVLNGSDYSAETYAEIEKDANSIIVKEIIFATGQRAEYAISTSANINDIIGGWQTDMSFRSLTADTAYYIFVRAQENDEYAAGTAAMVLQTKTTAEEKGGNEFPIGLVIGITAGALVLLGGGFCLYWFLIRKRKKA